MAPAPEVVPPPAYAPREYSQPVHGGKEHKIL